METGFLRPIPSRIVASVGLGSREPLLSCMGPAQLLRPMRATASPRMPWWGMDGSLAARRSSAATTRASSVETDVMSASVLLVSSVQVFASPWVRSTMWMPFASSAARSRWNVLWNEEVERSW